ncbi:hypothetical protein [Bradyrhizobium sp. 141]|uniref:hypothetical protein n=1 Tax=Bradyrhizobium sp. 141 TaxID=2782617 RepID=UPI001FFAD5F2|nr:hypothetical protein [Bradyrhizobium sp. 141]MCK1719895.1 hypothetical protein [Bradyrhizobium sp. 141]
MRDIAGLSGSAYRVIQQLAAGIGGVPTVSSDLIAERAGGCLAVKDGSFISLRVIRCWQHAQRHCRVWTLRRSSKQRSGLVVVIRLDEQNKQPLDFILTSMSRLPECPLIMTNVFVDKRFRRSRFKNLSGLVRALRRKLAVAG